MDSYSAMEVFTQREIDLWKRATRLVDVLPPDPTFEIRCHELSRAVGRILGLEHCDGSYGFAEHSWCWTSKLDTSPLTRETRLGFPNILDVYSVGQLPMVRLVACGNPGLPHVGWAYRPGKERDDIDEKMVERLSLLMSPTFCGATERSLACRVASDGRHSPPGRDIRSTSTSGRILSVMGPPPAFYNGTLWTMPKWVQHGVAFALDGQAWRVVTVGSHNSVPGRTDRSLPHFFVPYVSAEPIDTPESWSLPDAPCPKVDVADALAKLRALRKFMPDDMARAIHVEAGS